MTGIPENTYKVPRSLSNKFTATCLHLPAPYLWEWNFTSTVTPIHQEVALSALESTMRKWSPAVSHPAFVVSASCADHATLDCAHTHTCTYTPPWTWEILKRRETFLFKWSVSSCTNIYDTIVSTYTPSPNSWKLPLTLQAHKQYVCVHVYTQYTTQQKKKYSNKGLNHVWR